jgi:3-oxoadipate enol-lactonase
MVGQWLAANHPERIERLVLIATSAYLGAAPAWLERAATVRAAGTTEVIADAVLARWFTPDWPPSHVDTMTRLRAEFCANPFEGYAGCCEAIAALDLRDELPRITAPTLVIGGAQDPAIPPEHQRAITAAVSGARLELVAEAAHIPSIQQPDTVNALIANHLGVSL